MRDVSEKSFRENRNTHFLFNNVSLKIVPFVRWCKKISKGHKSLKWQYGECVLHGGHVRLQKLTQKV